MIVFGAFGRPFTLADTTDAALMGLTVFVTLAWASVSWDYIERPLIARGHRHSYDAPPADVPSLTPASHHNQPADCGR